MGEPPPGSPREEAERLVAAAAVTASLATRGWLARAGRGATGAQECGVCPFCRALAAVRDPDPVLVERLARGAGDLAEGVSGLLRAVGGLLHPPEPTPAPDADGPDADARSDGDIDEEPTAGGPEADHEPEGESAVPRQVPPALQRRTPLVTDNLDTAS